MMTSSSNSIRELLRMRGVAFLDDKRVLREVGKKERAALMRFGARTRTKARRSMRYVKSLAYQKRRIAEGKRKRASVAPKASKPGEPPRAIQPHPWVRKHLYFAYSMQTKSVVTGPIRLPRSTNAPEILEYGGRVARRKNPRRRIRKIGDGGEVAVRGGKVIYAKLRTPEQVRRANRLNAQLYGPWRVTYRQAARPFMRPAAADVLSDQRSLWK